MTDDKKKPLDIIRIETEPPDYQAVVVRGVGYFRMPSEETMTDDPHPASAAWQDVEGFDSDDGFVYLAADVERARAADAQQIAVWRKMFESSEATLAEARQQIAALQDGIEQVQMSAEIADANAVAARRGLQDAEQQIAALRAENGQLRDALKRENKEICEAVKDAVGWQVRYQKAEAQLTALQAEQAQWQQKNEQLRCVATRWMNRADHGFDPEETDESVDYWRGVGQCAKELAALTAQPDGSLPTRQPKP